MASYFVSPPERSDWSLSGADLRRLLVQRYPHATVRDPWTDADAAENQLHWSIPSASGTPLEGALHAFGDALHMDGDVDDAAEFAVWLRSLVPPEQPLVFYDQGYTADVAITPESRPEDLAVAFID